MWRTRGVTFDSHDLQCGGQEGSRLTVTICGVEDKRVTFDSHGVQCGGQEGSRSTVTVCSVEDKRGHV